MEITAIFIFLIAMTDVTGWRLWAIFSPNASEGQRDAGEFVLSFSPEFFLLAMVVRWIRRND